MLAVENMDRFILMAIDPGLNNTGIAIFDISVSPFKINKIKAETLKSERLIDDSCLDDDDFIERLHKRYKMGNTLYTLLEAYDPCVVVSESPFFDRRKPGSFAILNEVITTLFDTVIKRNPLTRFSMVEPLLVKKTLGVAGEKGKEVVREAMAKQETILAVLEDPLEQLDDHAIDAIGVGYTWVTRRSGLV